MAASVAVWAALASVLSVSSSASSSSAALSASAAQPPALVGDGVWAPLPCAGLLSPSLVATLADIATANVDTEYPNLIHHTMQSDADVMPPRRLTPAFFGSYDWHSAVHSHWQLGTVRCCRRRACAHARARAPLRRPSLSRTRGGRVVLSEARAHKRQRDVRAGRAHRARSAS